MRIRNGFICMLVGLTVGFLAHLAWAGPSPVYRMSQLEEVKKRAAAEGKPIAWIGAFATNLAPYAKILGKGSHAATAYAIRALQNDTILIASDAATENHTEPGIVDRELHTPEPHYLSPVVVILTPSMDKVVDKILYTAEAQDRIRVYTAALKKIRDKKSWEEKPAK